jgi:hypothetical protein
LAVYRSVRAKGDTKTRKSRRLLQMPKRATESLKEHRKRQAAERLPRHPPSPVRQRPAAPA